MNNDTTCCAVPCDQSVAERPRYYARQLITSDDLTLEQDYFRSKLRLHNRLLHGWGVVCGAQVCSVPKANSGNNTDQREPWKVMVCPGYVLGPYGDEIYIDCNCTVDLRTRGVVGVTGEPCADASDPWCSEVHEQRETTKLYVAVRYKQIATRPVRVQPIGCGCDDNRCESSRWRDGYEIGILTSWPDCGIEPPKFEELWQGSLSKCAPCPEQPWVVLAGVEVVNGEVTINNCECRRLVASFTNFWWACTEAKVPVCVKFAEYGILKAEEELVHLKEFAVKLEEEPDTDAYIVGYGDGFDRAKGLTTDQLVPLVKEPARINVLNGGARDKPLLVLYVCQPGAKPSTVLVKSSGMHASESPAGVSSTGAPADAKEAVGAAHPAPKKPPKKPGR